jgi:Region found in RelA / SpoT proteins
VSVPGLSNSQIKRLGDRIAAEGPLIDQDQELLRKMLSHYQETLVDAVNMIEPIVASFNRYRDFNVTVTSRPKTTEAIQEKIRRQSTNLANMEDVAGLRLVDPDTMMTRNEQDELCRRIKAALGPERFKKEVDRRRKPSHGYRAMHLIAKVNDVPVEIQVRTALQDLWAQAFENFAGRWGRQIRYGEPLAEPGAPISAVDSTSRQEVLDILLVLSDLVNKIEERACELESLEAEHPLLSQDEGFTHDDRLDVDELRTLFADAKEAQSQNERNLHDLLRRSAALAHQG